jgi:hypothetical protein
MSLPVIDPFGFIGGGKGGTVSLWAIKCFSSLLIARGWNDSDELGVWEAALVLQPQPPGAPRTLR